MSASHVSQDRRDFIGLAGAGVALAAAGSSPLAWAAATPLKIGFIGAGREGGALGALFAKAGHRVMFSSRNPETLGGVVAAAGPNARAGTVAEAVAFGDVIVLVVPYGALPDLAKTHAPALAAKTLVIDVSNPIAGRDGADLFQWTVDQGGAGLATAKLFPGAKLVRAFNAINYAALPTAANRAGAPVGVPIAGDDQRAVALATRLVKEAGFEAVLVGGLAKGKHLVPGTPLAGLHTPAELRQIAAGLS